MFEVPLPFPRQMLMREIPARTNEQFSTRTGQYEITDADTQIHVQLKIQIHVLQEIQIHVQLEIQIHVLLETKIHCAVAVRDKATYAFGAADTFCSCRYMCKLTDTL